MAQGALAIGAGRAQRFVADMVCKPGDSAEVRFQKTLFVTAAALEFPAGLVWGALYLVFDEPLAAGIPFGYSAATLVNMGLCRLTGWYQVFRLSQMVMTLVLPFLLMEALGGFGPSSGVVLWSITVPLGALAFASRREAVAWFAAFVGLVVLGAALEPVVQDENNLPAAAVVALFAMNIAGPALVAFGLLQYFVGQKDVAYGLLRREQERSERLLLNVLPAEIAARYECVSVLFVDIVGSTALAVELPPERMVGVLDEVFSHFDALVEKHGLEKIRTMGDSYMVASGVPKVRADHAQALARMALEMREYVGRSETAAAVGLRFRMGINSRPAVAGVIGQKKFQYDIWGDAVNTAARMETYGAPGRIQVSKAIYEFIKDEFACVPRGAIEVKGKGMMETWWLEGAR